MTAYNRGQVLYRLAEMVEARTAEFAELCTGRDEVERPIDRIVWYAGWADKLRAGARRLEPRRRPVLQLHRARADRRRRRARARRAAAARARLARRSRRSSAGTPSSRSRRRRARSRRSSSRRRSRRPTSRAASSTSSPAYRAELAPVARLAHGRQRDRPLRRGRRLARARAAAAENVKRVVRGGRRAEPVGDRLASSS